MPGLTTIKDILGFLVNRQTLRLPGFKLDEIIKRPAPITNAKHSDISFCGATAKNPMSLLDRTQASVLIVDHDIPVDEASLGKLGVQVVILSNNARLDFMRVIDRFFARARPTGIHPSAVITSSSEIGPDVFIGPLCTIQEEVKIGAGAVIHAGVHIYDGVRIGRNVTIHSGSVIGSDGFGYERNEIGELVKFPHVGGVMIEDNVEIGANTCIDRGTLGDTLIRHGACIDNLVHIAHNVVVGRHAVVIAHVMIGGGTRIGDFAWVSPSACLRDRITVGAKSSVGLFSLVTTDVPAGMTVFGSPAREVMNQKRLLAHWNQVIAQAD